MPWKPRGSPRRFAASAAPVEVLSRVVRGADARDETWVCRRSVHRDAAETGTAAWDEFVQGFKDAHAATEMGFTASVIGAREAATWDVAASAVMTTADGGEVGRGSLKLVEMMHELRPRVLRRRVFSVLQGAAERVGEGEGEFMVVSIPVADMQRSPHAQYAREKDVVVASYVSVERFRKLPDTGDIEWIMAVASDAGGILPQWVRISLSRAISHTTWSGTWTGLRGSGGRRDRFQYRG